MAAHREANVDMPLVMANEVLGSVDERGPFRVRSAMVKEYQKHACAIGKLVKVPNTGEDSSYFIKPIDPS